MQQASLTIYSDSVGIWGCVSVTHGGGASMIAQTNDTEIHKPIRKHDVEIQSETVLTTTSCGGGRLKDTETTDEECIAIMAEVMSGLDLHVQGCNGYKHTGTTNAFDGSEDHIIANDAKIFWDELGMRERITPAVADLEKRYNDGTLPWEWKVVQREIIP